jgi:mono/diheme cytochrome c family protein
LGLGLVILALPGAEVPDQPDLSLMPDDRELVVQGRQVYRQYCASCHGARLEGQPVWQRLGPNGRLPAPPHDASGHTWHHPDPQLFALTKFGPAAMVPGYQSDMPGYEGLLSDQEIIAVLSYIKSRWPPDIRARHDQINAGFEASNQ